MPVNTRCLLIVCCFLLVNTSKRKAAHHTGKRPLCEPRDRAANAEWELPKTPLVIQQPGLTFKSAGIADQLPVLANYPMTGHHDAKRIFAIRHPYRPCRCGLLDRLSQLAVTPGGRIGNPPQLSPYPVLKVRAPGCQRQVELPALSIEVSVQLPAGLLQKRMRLTGQASFEQAPCLRHIGEQNMMNTGITGGDQQLSQR